MELTAKEITGSSRTAGLLTGETKDSSRWPETEETTAVLPPKPLILSFKLFIQNKGFAETEEPLNLTSTRIADFLQT